MKLEDQFFIDLGSVEEHLYIFTQNINLCAQTTHMHEIDLIRLNLLRVQDHLLLFHVQTTTKSWKKLTEVHI